MVDGYGKEAYTYYPILIVGAGESGIAMGCRLKEELGFDQFRIFDRQSGRCHGGSLQTLSDAIRAGRDVVDQQISWCCLW